MPRFGTKSLLIIVGVIALWFSTFAGYAAARDVRASVLLLILVASGFAALCSWRERRAFWIGFFAVMLLCGGNDLRRPLSRYVPTFDWISTALYTPPQGTTAGPVMLYPWEQSAEALRTDAIAATVAAAWTLTLAAVAGLIGVFIYKRNAGD
jgi:hypothetical protein